MVHGIQADEDAEVFHELAEMNPSAGTMEEEEDEEDDDNNKGDGTKPTKGRKGKAKK